MCKCAKQVCDKAACIHMNKVAAGAKHVSVEKSQQSTKDPRRRSENLCPTCNWRIAGHTQVLVRTPANHKEHREVSAICKNEGSGQNWGKGMPSNASKHSLILLTQEPFCKNPLDTLAGSWSVMPSQRPLDVKRAVS